VLLAALYLELVLATTGRTRDLVVVAGLIVAPALAAGSAVFAVRRRAIRVKAGWWVLSAGCLLWLAGWVATSAETLGGEPLGGPLGLPALASLFPVFAVVAVLLMNPGGSLRGPIGFVLDGVIGAVGLSLVTHQLVLRPIFEAGVSQAELWHLVVRVMAGLVLVSLLMMLAIRRRRVGGAAPAPPLDLGLALIAVGNAAFVSLWAQGSRETALAAVTALTFSGFLLMAMAGLRAIAGVPAEPSRRENRMGVAVLPLMLMALGAVVVLPDLARGPVLTANLVLGYAGQILVVVRLMVALLENARLKQDMEAKVAELEDAYGRLTELDELKSDFIATASHELRTPLTAVQGFIETLLRPEILASPEETREYLMIMRRSAARLRALIENLLLVSRIEQAGAVGNVSQLDLCALVRETVAEQVDDSHRVALDLPGVEVPVRMDRMHARTVVENLLSNARKFSPHGSDVDVSLEVDGPDAVLAVSDRGPGVAAGERDQLFEKFFRGQAAGGVTSGSGLGLYIVRRLADAVGGSVEYDGSHAGGARFVFRLPLAIAAQPAEPEPALWGEAAVGS
jgi:signal transduction histidine kinase